MDQDQDGKRREDGNDHVFQNGNRGGKERKENKGIGNHHRNPDRGGHNKNTNRPNSDINLG
jgi:hypothetical protein